MKRGEKHRVYKAFRGSKYKFKFTRKSYNNG